jgi:membrane protease YdiL (CAAX protease family)
MATTAQEDLPEETITFACQECGKSITFPADRGGHVEDCPECGRYVDVPHKTETPLPAESETAAPPLAIGKAEQQMLLDPSGRTAAQLWIEVSAILCLAYLPWVFYVLTATDANGPTDYTYVGAVLYRILVAAEISMPLLVILSLGKDRWSVFGIVRPKWITDAIAGCVIWFCGRLFRDFVLSLVPLSILRMPHPLYVADRVAPEGMPAYFMVSIAVIVGVFVEELVFRGYLIPRFERLLRSTWVAVVVTTAMFASCHMYQGAAGAIGAAAIGFVYAIAFCLLRRLWPLCVAHALHNIVIYWHLTR